MYLFFDKVLECKRVPKEKSRGPRININFRYILSSRDELALRGIRAFYKYMVSGDAKTSSWDITATPVSYDEIVKKSGPMHMFVKRAAPSNPRIENMVHSGVEPSPPREGNTRLEFAPEGAVVIKRKGVVEDGNQGWVCSKCTYINENISDNQCEVCCSVRSQPAAADRNNKGNTTNNSASNSSMKKARKTDDADHHDTGGSRTKTLFSFFGAKSCPNRDSK